MARTLADMTPEEREACVGMWCEVMVKTQIGVSTSPREPRLGILASLDWNGFWGRGGGFDFAGHVSPEMWENATPRFDLMRAWNPDGTPVSTTEEAEYRIVDPDTNGGKYQVKRHTRHVTEWRLNDE